MWSSVDADSYNSKLLKPFLIFIKSTVFFQHVCIDTDVSLLCIANGSHCYRSSGKESHGDRWGRDWITQGGSLQGQKNESFSAVASYPLRTQWSLFTLSFLHCLTLTLLYIFFRLFVPPSHSPLSSCLPTPPLTPSFFPLSFVLHSSVPSLHFERNRFSITCWVPGSFYISQPDPNTAEVTPQARETHTHRYIYMNTHTLWYTSISTYSLMEWRRGWRISSESWTNPVNYLTHRSQVKPIFIRLC